MPTFATNTTTTRMVMERTPITEQLHLWALVGYTCVTGLLALICLLCAHQLQKTHERAAAKEAREARRGDYAPWSVVTENGARSGNPWRPRTATHLRIAAYAFSWWALSVSFTLVNKYFLYYWKAPARPGVFVPPGFPFAVTTTTLHLTMKVVLSTATIRWRQYRLAKRLSRDEASAEEASTIVVPEELSRSTRWKYAYSTGATTALDIATSNLALLYVTVSFYTVAKTTTLAWTLIWATAFRLEPCRLKTVLVVLVIVGGLVLATEGERHQTYGFSAFGTILVLVAACLGGARWCLTQALFSRDAACAEDPVVVVYHVSPAGVLTLLPIALLWEFPRLYFWLQLVSTEGAISAFLFACGAGVIAYLMLLAEVKLLHETSSLSLSVGGALKDVSQICLASVTFGDEITLGTAAGLVLVLAASLAYAKSRAGRRRSASVAEGATRYAVVTTKGDFDDALDDDDLNDNELL